MRSLQPDIHNIIPKPRASIPYPKPKPRRPAWLINKPKQPKKTTFFITGALVINRDVMVEVLEGEDYRVVPTLQKGVHYVLVGDLPSSGWNRAIGRR